MKKIIIVFMLLCSAIAEVACGNVIENNSTTDNESTIKTTMETTPIIETKAILTTNAITNSSTTEVTTVEFDIQMVVKELCMKYYNSPGYTEENAMEDAAYMIERAREFTEHDPVEVKSEDAAKSRAKTVFITYLGQEFINTLESDLVEKNGETLKLVRDAPPYKCVYYDEYDVWIVTAVLRSGKLEDGTGLEHTGESPYVIINGKDGALLAAHC